MSDELNLEKIQKLIDLAKKKNLADFSYESKEVKIAFSFVNETVAKMPLAHFEEVPPRLSSSNNSTNAANSVATTAPQQQPKTDPSLIEVKAPFVGTFYHSSAPDAPAYVQVGQRVKVGQILGLVEAMKIMNEIEAPQDGEIVQVCTENEGFVEYGQVLFKMKK